MRIMLSGRSCFKLCCKRKIQKKKLFKNIWIQPAGDAGAGSAWFVFSRFKNERNIKNDDLMKNAYLGPIAMIKLKKN